MTASAYTLYPYQQKFIADLREAMRKYMRIIGCAATGSGKSKTFIAIARMAIDRGMTVLVISESRKIFRQLAAEVTCTHIAAGVNKDLFIRAGSAYLAMAQTLIRRPQLIRNFAHYGNKLLVITDEIHIATPMGILQQLPAARHIGFTATPIGKHLSPFFEQCVVGPQPAELVKAGYLTPYRHYGRVAADLNALELANGEFTEASQQAVFESDTVYDALEEDLTNIAYKKCLIFTASIKDCDHVYERLRAAAFDCVRVHSGLTKDEEAYQLGRFTHLNAPICVSVGVLTKGFDMPAIDMSIIRRATTSLPLYLQMLGRQSRKFPGKLFSTTLDYGGNWLRHGLWDDERPWATMWNAKPKKKKDAPPPVKMCPQCMYLNAAAARVCAECGYVFSKPDDDELALSKLIEVTHPWAGRLLSSLTPVELAAYAQHSSKRMYAMRVARAQEQRTPGFLKQFGGAMNYKAGWYYREREALPAEEIKFTDMVL